MSRNRTVITLGSFDGVHRGHQAILRKVVRLAQDKHAVPLALVFNQPPRLVQNPLDGRQLITTLPEKLALLRQSGIRKVQTLEFDQKTSSMSPQDFFSNIVVAKHHAAAMVVGPRVAFGKNRAGDLPLLRQLGQQHGVDIHSVSLVGPQKASVSSSRIRDYLRAGHVEKAAAALGKAYTVSGRVVRGDQRGRVLGFPTMNVDVSLGKILPPGVFWVKVYGLRDTPVNAVCNIGARPTFESSVKKVVVEVHVWGKVLPSCYGRTIQISFHRRLRSEKRFKTVQSLIHQITRDVARAKRLSYNPGD